MSHDAHYFVCVLLTLLFMWQSRDNNENIDGCKSRETTSRDLQPSIFSLLSRDCHINNNVFASSHMPHLDFAFDLSHKWIYYC